MKGLQEERQKHIENADDSEKVTFIGYPDVRKALQDEMDKWENRGPADLKDLEELYGKEFPGKPGKRGWEPQLSTVEAEERALLGNSPQNVEMSNLLFAPDLLQGGLAIDRIVESLIKGEQEQGNVYEAQRRAHNSGQEENLSLIQLLQRGDPRADQWGTRIGKDILMSSNFFMPVATSKFLVRWVAGHIQGLRAVATRANELKAAQAGGGKKT